MCRMTETGFRWQSSIPVPLISATWYVYERGPGEYRYSQACDDMFRPMYAIRIKAKINQLTAQCPQGFFQP